MKGRVPKKHRSANTIAPLKVQFEAATLGLLAKLRGTSGFVHRLSKGLERERALLRELFERTFPQKFAFASGEVHDLWGTASGQLDIIIFNRQKNFLFYSDFSSILPAEAPLAAIEVKTEISRKSLIGAFEAAHALKSLRPFSRELSAPRKDGKPANDGQARYFYTVFAFGSAISDDNWPARTLRILSECSANSGIPMSVVDRIYCINRGLLIPPENNRDAVFFPELRDSGEALFRFYLDILNFSEREDLRRPGSDLESYSGKPTQKPIKIPSADFEPTNGIELTVEDDKNE